jgi:hypothetical protein
VGYKMAVPIETRRGRPDLIRCLEDPRKLLATYNQIATDKNRRELKQRALWSHELLEEIGARAVVPRNRPRE